MPARAPRDNQGWKSLVEGHGGRIRVESTEGVGSVFLIELPASS